MNSHSTGLHTKLMNVFADREYGYLKTYIVNSISIRICSFIIAIQLKGKLQITKMNMCFCSPVYYFRQYLKVCI